MIARAHDATGIIAIDDPGCATYSSRLPFVVPSGGGRGEILARLQHPPEVRIISIDSSDNPQQSEVLRDAMSHPHSKYWTRDAVLFEVLNDCPHPAVHGRAKIVRHVLQCKKEIDYIAIRQNHAQVIWHCGRVQGTDSIEFDAASSRIRQQTSVALCPDSPEDTKW